MAASRGIVVPDDLSITGFDDVEICAHLQPSLTSVHTDVVAWGRAAATRLLELIDNDDDTGPADLPDARLVVRSSTSLAADPVRPL
jgi:LacI family repressor for deo operon, udp, cdd, tsx, nupC, and nupG